MRVVFNFEHHCSLNCPWCYISFGGTAPESEYCMRIVDELLNYGVDYITFGGGDPSSYTFIEQLARTAKSGGAFVHLDTNAIGFYRKESSLAWIPEVVCLVGLPIDGPNSEIHASVRGARKSFDAITSFAGWLSKNQVPLKFNTFLNPKNVACIRELLDYVSRFKPRLWSIYEYWEPSAQISIKGDWSSSISDLKSAEKDISSFRASFDIELVRKHTRRLNYPIVTHEGRVYTHSVNSLSSYDDIGSIFCTGTLEKAFDLCAQQSEKAELRYRSRFS